MKQVFIIGGGFIGLNAAKALGGAEGVEVTLVDGHNHHLSQPLLYQLATAEMRPAQISLHPFEDSFALQEHTGAVRRGSFV